MKEYNEYECWVAEAERMMAEDDFNSCNVDGVGHVSFLWVSNKSVEARVGNRRATVAGAAEGLVGRLFLHLRDKQKFSPDVCHSAMCQLFGNCDG